MPGRIEGDILRLPRYRQIFEIAVGGYIRQVPPAISDVTQQLGLTPSSVHNQVKRLQSEGLVQLVDRGRASRYIELSPLGIERADLRPRAAHSLGTTIPEARFEFDAEIHRAKCGRPTWADGQTEPLNMRRLFKNWQTGDRVIYAEGDSMVHPDPDFKDSIYEDDIVHARDSLTPKNGERVYVEYELGSGEHECMIKQWFKDPKTAMVTLHAFNPDPAYPDVIRHVRDVRVHSVVLDVRRLVGAEAR